MARKQHVVENTSALTSILVQCVDVDIINI